MTWASRGPTTVGGFAADDKVLVTATVDVLLNLLTGMANIHVNLRLRE
jgi:hypothetical protein